MQKVKQSLTIILIVLLCTFLLNVPMVMAETETTTVPDVTTQTTDPTTDQTTDPTTDPTQILDVNGEPVDTGILPDSPLYWLSVIFQKLQVALTFDKTEKVALIEEQALENLAEAAVMIEEDQSEDAEVTLNAYSEKIAAALEYVNAMDPNSEDGQKLLTALTARNSSNVQTLGNLLDKLPPQAAQRVAVNVVRTMTKSIEKYDKKIQIQLKHDLKKTTELLENTELDEETETALEGLENIDQTNQTEQTDQTDQTSATNTDVDEDQVDNTTDTEVTVENNKKENKHEVVTGQDSNPGQTNKEQKEEKNNNIKNDNENNNDINNDVIEDGQGDETQKDNNNGSGKNNSGGNGGGKGNKH